MNSYNEVKSWLDSMAITDYVIKPDLSIDVDGSVIISDWQLSEIPVQFNWVSGSFMCNKNHLKSLKGAPRSVGGDFICGENQLVSLEDGPSIVGEVFNCSHNQLKSLKGAPSEVFLFGCNANLLTSLEYGPSIVRGSYACMRNKLRTLKGAPKNVPTLFLSSYNRLKNLEFCPQYIGENFICNNNPISSFEFLPESVGGSLVLPSKNKLKTHTLNFKSEKPNQDIIISLAELKKITSTVEFKNGLEDQLSVASASTKQIKI